MTASLSFPGPVSQGCRWPCIWRMPPDLSLCLGVFGGKGQLQGTVLQSISVTFGRRRKGAKKKKTKPNMLRVQISGAET